MEILAAYELNSIACLNIVFKLKQQVPRFYSCILFLKSSKKAKIFLYLF